MRKRNERRNNIQATFERLCSTVASTLGSAANTRSRVQDECARRTFAMRIAQVGLARVEQDPTIIETEDREKPLFAEALANARAERTEIFADWTASGPARLTELVSAAAPGTASQPPEEWLGNVGSGRSLDNVPELWRIGTARVPNAPDPQPFPAAVRLLDESHLYLSSTTDSRASMEDVVQNLLMRVLGHFEPGLVRLHVWDVAQLTGTLPGLFPLASAGLLTAYDPQRVGDMLEELSDHIRRIYNESLLGEHTSLRALSTATREERREPWRIAVLFGDGQPLRDEQQQQLQRVARNGLACGIQLIVADLPLTVNSAVESIQLFTPELARSSVTGPYAEIRPDEAMPRGQVTRACTAIAEHFNANRSRARTFHDLLPEQLYTQRSLSGLQTPVGFAEAEPVRLSLGDASPHALIGGPSGSGKTNFLYGMLAGLAARYSPDELELYLLDFKEGVSFAQFTPGRRDPSWLPHAQLVGVNVNTDREFGLALLRFLSDEMRRRADAAKEHEVTKLEELRVQDPGGRWPRIVAVIDEFQFLFAERDPVSSQATTLLEDVARRGRSQGIHLVLASQEISGIEAFWGKAAIFEQFIVRIALPKARRVLVDQNPAAIELPRWHAVVNHESGVKHGNAIAHIPNATERGTFDELQQRLWERRGADSAPPRLFDGSLLPALSSVEDFQRLTVGDAAPRALLGQVIDVDGTAATVRLARSPGRNIAVIGSVTVDAASVLGSAALSLARQRSTGHLRFTVASLIGEAHSDALLLVDTLRAAGHEVELVGMDGIENALNGLVDVIEQRSSRRTADDGVTLHCLVLYAADAAHSLLERKDPQTRISGQDQLRKVLRQGPELGVHTLGWWRSAQRVKNSLGVGPVDDIGAWVAFDVHGQELSSFAAGQVVNWSPRARRGLFFDRSRHSRPEVVLPFDLSDLEKSGERQAVVPEQRHHESTGKHDDPELRIAEECGE